MTEEVAPTVLADILARLVRQAGPERRMEVLLEKARQDSLDEPEKEELRGLLSRGAEKPVGGDSTTG